MTATEPDYVLIDSSAWTQLFRRDGDPVIVQHVRELLVDGRAAWCDVIRLELWRGAGSPSDEKLLRSLETELRSLPLSPAVGDRACDLARRCRKKGFPVPTTDLIIFACGDVHKTPLLHRDKHFDFLKAV